MTNKRLSIIAHRCCGFGEPENSIAAFDMALRSKVDELEIDVRLTRDNRFVASHMPWYFDSNRRPHVVAWQTLAQAEACGAMTLQVALDLFRERGRGKRLRVEIKPATMGRRLTNVLQEFGDLDQLVVASWHPRTLKAVHRKLPEMALSYSFIPGLHAGFPVFLRDPQRLPKIIEQEEVPLRSVNLLPLLSTIPKQLIAEIQKKGIDVMVVSNGSQLEEILTSGASGIFTKQPQRVLAKIQAATAPAQLPANTDRANTLSQ